MLSRLLLMRHAKSSWSDGQLTDHERPLNNRGRRAAAEIGSTLHARGYAPDLRLCCWGTILAGHSFTIISLGKTIPTPQAHVRF